ncbi:MAG TPA: hypothetical protein VFV66_25115, partial [Nonomuraea sp.]|nr:hypothetical protein [Nonomuraea sp.]
MRCGRAIGGQLSPPGERLSVAAPPPFPKRREGTKVVAAALPPKPAYGAGCLGGMAAAVLLVVEVGLWVGLGARGVSLSLPGPWRASGEVSVAELVQAAERLERGSVGLAVGAGPSGRSAGRTRSRCRWRRWRRRRACR